jgi:CDP-glycerol glycerophosphotransferase (TagB/SpsB family)
MEKYDYTGILCLHPYFSKHWIDFKQNKIFSVLSECNYQKLLLKSSLLITDYSSIFFDFGYLNKPVIKIYHIYKYKLNS